VDRNIMQQPPATRGEMRVLIAALDDKIAAIRTQIATNDLERQTSRKPLDPRWFHRAKTALRHLQRERAELFAKLSALSKPRDGLKDCLIAVLRERHDEASWAAIMDEAHRRLDGEAP
jgi:hypothetical protein